MRLRLLAALVLAAAPAAAQVPVDTLAQPRNAPSRAMSRLDPCGPADPLRARLIGGSTACPLAPGEGHVSLRGVAVTVIPVGAAVQASMGAGRGVVLGVSTAGNLGGDRAVMGSLRAPLWHRGRLRVAAGGHIGRTIGSRADYDYAPLVTKLAPYVVATVAVTDGATMTAQLTTPVSLFTYGPGPRRSYASRDALQPSAGLTLATGRSSRLIIEAGALLDRSRGELLGDAPLIVGAAMRTLGRRGAFEIGVVTIPGELDACRDSEAYLCLPPVLPTMTFTRAFGRR